MKNDKTSGAAYTYCNPLPIPDIPRGKDDWYANEDGMFSHENKPVQVTTPDYRSISDPTVFYHDGKWYLYPSYGMAWVSEDFHNWKHVRTEPYCPKYSPAIVRWKDKFLLTAWICPLYVADSPLGPFKLLGDFIGRDGVSFKPCDPAMFADDDGRLYLYAFDTEPNETTGKFTCKIVGYELDTEDPRRVIRGPMDIIKMNPENVWERRGRYHQDKYFGWVEGPHLLKHNGRYYMIYAAPDTCDTSYCMAVYYSDDSPLSGFVCQKRNPLTFHEGGLITGAGHGCVEHGPNGSLWSFYTISTPITHRYERRIGMDRVEVDKNGELYCPFGVTDRPQYIPGYREVSAGQPDLVSLTSGVRPQASSYRSEHYAFYATDESNLSWWEPSETDEKPWIECDLDGQYIVSAVRLFWRDVNLNYAEGRIPSPVDFLLEGYKNGEWFTLLNEKQEEEKNIDYHIFADVVCEKVRLNIKKRNDKTTNIGLIDFSVFGRKK
ncbi:MAG: family 43 glycosylhydrolase [Clostridia bacterium]|nr:family 43 glycosylhydrolase [Clostridia bacterium]